MKRCSLVLAAVLLLTPARADIIVFDSFSTGGPFGTHSIIANKPGAIPSQHVSWAAAFQPTQTVDLTRIEMQVRERFAPPPASPPAQAWIMTNDAKDLPAAVLESLNFSFPAVSTTVAVTASGAVRLHSTDTYWLALTAPLVDTEGVWEEPATPLIGMVATSFVADPQTPADWFAASDPDMPAFRIIGTASAVPEPSTWVLLGLGAMALVLWRRGSAASRA